MTGALVFARRKIIRLLVALMCAVILLIGSCDRAPRNNGTNVLLIIMDTVRADRLSCYGYDRPTTPAIDEVSRHGVLFENAFANSSWTLPSHASIFTGMYPVGHRATQETMELSVGPATLAEVLGAAGYATIGISSNAVVSLSSGLARGFDEFVEAFRPEVAREAAALGLHPNNRAFDTFLERTEKDEPFFAFVNYIEAHAPYQPPEPVRSRYVDERDSAVVAAAMQLNMPDHYMHHAVGEEQFKILGQLYDAEINLVDRAVGHLLAALARDGRLSNTTVIIASDHGENLGDHGHFAHVFSLYNTTLAVPLIVIRPGDIGADSRRSDVVQLIDLFPTILAGCGVHYSGRVDGRDLFAEGAESQSVPAMAEYYYPRQVLSVFDEDELRVNVEHFIPYMRRLRAMQDGRHKLIWASAGASELYDLAGDPAESADLLAARPDHPGAAALLRNLNGLVQDHTGDTPLDPPPPPGWKMPGLEARLKGDPELLEQLRSLGYIR